jgi:hypothetical protein
MLFFTASLPCLAQNLPDMGLYRVRITDTAGTTIFEIKPVNSPPRARPDRTYYWYDAGTIQATQGGFSGKLLNGSYDQYYRDKSLKEQGAFHKGLKVGTWKNWNRDGSLATITKWDKGKQLTESKVPFLKRLHLPKLRKKHVLRDTSKKA